MKFDIVTQWMIAYLIESGKIIGIEGKQNYPLNSDG